MAEGKRCIECLSIIPKEASVCRHCGIRVEGIKCQNCSSFCKPDAKICKWCGRSIQKLESLKLSKPMEVQASFWGTLLLNFSFHPQQTKFTKEKIIVSSFGFFGLTRNDEEIVWEKVAGFEHKDGLIWDVIWIETRGQTRARIIGLKKDEALKIKTLLQRLEK